MSRKENSSRFSMRKQKSYLTVGVIALVAVIAMVGIYYKKTADQKAEQKEAVIMAESQWTEDTDTEKSSGESGQTGNGGEDAPAEETGESPVRQEEAAEDVQNTVNIVGNTEEAVTSIPDTESVEPHFSESDSLGWPISGNVILNYSMDQSVYFATLDQYKYNPALIIEGAVNDKVNSAADGQVLSVEITEETGGTVAVDIGDGYQLMYGQLKDIQVSPGDSVKKGELIGFVSEPTKYYSVEGSNLYLEMLKDGEPVNPMNYLE